jgi:hypothetical protein
MRATRVLAAFAEHGIAYLVVGPSAILVHQGELGTARSLSLCYRQDWTNCECLTRALDQLRARVLPPRAAPIPVTAELRQASKAVRFRSPAGPIHLAPAVPELGPYDDLLPQATRLDLDGAPIPVLSVFQLDLWLERALRPGAPGAAALLRSLRPRAQGLGRRS